MKKRIFLGAYLNSTNAQNLNCLALAQHLNQDKYTLYALKIYASSGNLSTHLPHVNYFTCFYPHKISRYLGYLWGIWHCDIAYLPKGELANWNWFLLKLLRKKSFITIEGKIKNTAATKAYRRIEKMYAITKYIRDYSNKFFNLNVCEKILYLGVDISTFANPNRIPSKLTDIIFIGRLKKRKGLDDLLLLAKQFPNLNFHFVGRGEEDEESDLFAKIKQIKNIHIHGLLTHEQISALLKYCQLHIFPSRDEGFGKVTMETAAAGVPSIVYSDYGAAEWIDNMKNGFIVDTLEQTTALIQGFLSNPTILFAASKNAVQLAQRFEWKNLIANWETIMDAI